MDVKEALEDVLARLEEIRSQPERAYSHSDAVGLLLEAIQAFSHDAGLGYLAVSIINTYEHCPSQDSFGAPHR